MQTFQEASTPIEFFFGGEQFMLDGVMQDDFYPAICRAQGFLETQIFQSSARDINGSLLPPIKGTYSRTANVNQTAIRLTFQAQTYHFSHTIEVVRQLHLLGVHSELGFIGGTRFRFPPKTMGLIVHNISSGHLRTVFDPGNEGDYVVSTTYTEPTMVDRSLLGDGMAIYCGWVATNLYPSSVTPFNDATTINPSGTIIENIFFFGGSDSSKDIFPDFKLVVGTSDAILHDRSGDTVLSNPYETHSAWTIQDYLNFNARKNYDSWLVTSKAFHGLMLLSTTEVRKCTISNFSGHGIYIFGNSYQNNDFCKIDCTNIYANNGNGLHISGGDAGLASVLNVSSTKNAGWGIVHISRASANAFISCQGSYNYKGGFLAPVGVHMPVTIVQKPDLRTVEDEALGVAPPLTIVMPQPIIGDAEAKPNIAYAASAVFLSCYSESNWGAELKRNNGTDSFLNPACILIACSMGYLVDGHAVNFHTFDDGSLITEGAVTGLGKRSSARLISEQFNYTAATLGDTSFTNVALSMTHRYEVVKPLRNELLPYGLGTRLHIEYREHTIPDPADPENKVIIVPDHYWSFRSANLAYMSPLSISTLHNTDVGSGQLWLEGGVFIGYKADPFAGGNKRIRIMTSTAKDLDTTVRSYGISEGTVKPTEGSSNMYEWEEGDVILNKQPAAGGNVGWICCRNVSNGVLQWYPYGDISKVAVASNSVSYELVRASLTNVDDAAGRWQHEGGIIRANGIDFGHYCSQKRVTMGGTDALNCASINITLFLPTTTGLGCITMQGVHEFNSGDQSGSVSSVSKQFAHHFGQQFHMQNNIMSIG
jgi:hypothetical protein